MDANRKAEARELVDQPWWGSIGKILHARRCLKVALDALDAAEARAERAEAYARDAEQAAARACMELFGRRHADPRPDFWEVEDGR